MGGDRLADPAAAGGALIPKVGFGATPCDYPSYFPLKIDNAAFAARAVEYFVKKGRRRVAALCQGAEGPSKMIEHFAAAAAAHSGVTAPPEWQIGIQNFNAGGNIVRLLMSLPASKRPNALLVGDDHLVEHVTRGLIESGVKVPGDLEVVAIWNWPNPPPRFLDFTFLGYDVDQLVKLSVDAIDTFNTSGKFPEDNVVKPLFAGER